MILKFHNRPYHLCKLHDELLAAVPALRPQPGPSGELKYQNAIPQAQVEGLQQQVHKLLSVEEKPAEQKE